MREFLIEQTGDPAWPILVDERGLSALLLEGLPAALEAHRNLRQVASTRFRDSDLYKIALGSALKISLFRRLSPSEIRRLCIEQHATLEGLEERLPGDVVATLHSEIAKAPSRSAGFLTATQSSSCAGSRRPLSCASMHSTTGS